MGVPVCKRIRCVHVNKHAALLVGRTCVASLLKTRDDRDSAPVRTRTSQRLPRELTKELNGKITHMGGKNDENQTSVFLY